MDAEVGHNRERGCYLQRKRLLPGLRFMCCVDEVDYYYTVVLGGKAALRWSNTFNIAG